MIIDGKKIAEKIFAETKARAEKLSHPPLVVALAGLQSSVAGSYVTLKEKRAGDAGCAFEVREVDAFAGDADAVIVQLPLPAEVDTKQALDAIPLEKDADVLSSAAREAFAKGDSRALLPPVVGAVREILVRNSVEVKGKRVVVLGQGFLVGEPVATWLTGQGAHVEIITLESGSLESLKNANLIVSGAGSPGLIKPEMLTPGVVLIDAGTSELGGKIVGDADPACAEVASIFTPVPGGVGPIAVACLFKNAVTLAERTQK